MIRVLVCLMLCGCAAEPLVLGEPVPAPFGYRMMCHQNPDAFACP